MVKNIGLTLLSEGKTIRLKAHGYSMYPNIRPGSLLLIEPIHLKGDPVPGEIIAIVKNDGLIVHRLIKIEVRNNVKNFIARGDSNAWSDYPVKIGKIAGRIVGAETTGENPVRADIRIKARPGYIINRLRIIGMHLWKKIK